MSSLTEALAAAAATTAPRQGRTRTAPSGFEPGVKYDGGRAVEATVSFRDIPADETEWRAEIKRVTGLDLPATQRVEIKEVRLWGQPGLESKYVRFGIETLTSAAEQVDLAELIKVAKANRKASPRKTITGRTRMVVVSDLQIGKVDARGGTPELLARIDHLMGALEDEAKATPCDDAVILDPGDLMEGFENTAQQAFTNDLSFPEQLRYGRVILTDIVTRVAAKHAATRVATVGSNHTAWRRGKDSLGRPGDDFGIETHRTVADALALAGRTDVSFVIPEMWDESLSITVRGAIVGLTHGHKVNNPNGFPDWWAKQTHGGGPLAAANICVSGHFHHLRVQPSGSVDGKAKWWFQAPTLDNGSSWYANAGGGSDTEPGLLTFTIDDSGAWDNLRLLS